MRLEMKSEVIDDAWWEMAEDGERVRRGRYGATITRVNVRRKFTSMASKLLILK